jgi:endonuclease/exonuclease/phosphatase family metal-dependent hydrolase
MRIRIQLSTAGPILVAACGLALLLAAPPGAPADAGARASVTAGSDTAVPTTLVAARTTTRLVVVNHNIEKRTSALERALAAARNTAAPVITLQEICGWQVDDLRASHPDWTITYRAEDEHDKCLRPGTDPATVAEGADPEPESAPTTGESPRALGNAAIWTGGPTGVSTFHTYRHQRSAADRTGMACVSWTVEVVHRACSVHLIAPLTGAQIRVRTQQAQDVRLIARRWIARDELVVLAGDFNAQPGRHTMSHLYDRGGRGDFVEAGRHDPLDGRCSCHRVTLASRSVKIDYVFFSANRTRATAERGLRVIRTPSDHHLLVGRADVDASPR